VFVSQGWISAVIMVVIVLLVQQLESHVLQPILMGHAVSLHPIAVAIVVAMGIMTFGIVGGLFAVPIAAVGNTFIQYLFGHDKFPQLGTDDHVPLLRQRVVEERIEAIKETLGRLSGPVTTEIDSTRVKMHGTARERAVARRAAKAAAKRGEEVQFQWVMDDNESQIWEDAEYHV
jgi:hypothetical protein